MERLRYSAALVCAVLTILFASSLHSNSAAQASPGIVVALRSTGSPARLHYSSTTHVYLFRGLLNVFSLGMDQLAAQLQSVGIAATVANHTQWSSVADDIVAKYRAGQRGPIVLVGHSLGADAVMSMAAYLGQMGVPVALVVPFDGTDSHVATANVARVLNLYKNQSVRISRGPGFRGELTNYFVRDPNVNHFNIDKSAALHSIVIRKIRSIGSAVARPRGHQTPSNAVPAAGASTNS
ncbi:thioesterase domain-containing protein [Bradyrhizobium macuxiense]|nr:thioesterase domain-containing protein [Bradyrhizobium macuxiense]